MCIRDRRKIDRQTKTKTYTERVGRREKLSFNIYLVIFTSIYKIKIKLYENIYFNRSGVEKLWAKPSSKEEVVENGWERREWELPGCQAKSISVTCKLMECGYIM